MRNFTQNGPPFLLAFFLVAVIYFIHYCFVFLGSALVSFESAETIS